MSIKHRYLTKSRFQLAQECPRKLYYYGKSKYPNNKNTPFLAALAEGGFQVGALAKCYFPEGYDITEIDIDKSLQQTNELLKKDKVTIFEAAILYKNNFIRIDILKKDGKNFQLIEVKAKSFDDNKDNFHTKKGGYIIKKWRPYLNDVAFQTWVTEHAMPGYNVDPFLMLADKASTASVTGLNQHFLLIKEENGRTGIKIKGDVKPPKKLGVPILKQYPVRKLVEIIWQGNDIPDKDKNAELSLPFEKRVLLYSDYYKKNEPYPAIIGSKCKKCEYRISLEDIKEGEKIGYRECWSELLGWDDAMFDKPHIFDLWNFRKNDQCMDNGIYLMENLIPEEMFYKVDKDGNISYGGITAERQELQLMKTLNTDDFTEDIKPGLYEELNQWNFPLHFIDFETSMVAIPFNEGRHPYEQIAFQFSCHTIYEDGKVEHSEWISREHGIFPNFDFVRALKSRLDKDEGTILRFAAHENTVLRQILKQIIDARDNDRGDLPEDHSELIKFIDHITTWKDSDKIKHPGGRTMIDMCDLVRKHYYHPAMGGSNSIKVVLPAVMQASAHLKKKYSKPKPTTNSGNIIWWQLDKETEQPVNPYKLLPPLFEEGEFINDEITMDSGEIRDGGAAMTAYAKMQFSEMSDAQREKIIKGLLTYCELDTLAMVMIWEHWMDVAEN